MSSTRILRAFVRQPPPSVMPMDLALCLSLGRRQPLSQQPHAVKPQRRIGTPADTLLRTRRHSPSYSSSSSSSSTSTSPSASPLPSLGPRSCIRRDRGGGSLNKKRVVFADALGLALTAVRLYLPEPSGPSPSSSPDLSVASTPLLARLQNPESATDAPQRYKLGFLPPTQDIRAFVTRLREARVQLESCVVKDRQISGKVCVFLDGTERAMFIKVTFDSWRSYRDIPCSVLRRGGGGADPELAVYAFDLSLPQNLDPEDRVEFCVCSRSGPGGAAALRDDNGGQNYRLCLEKDAPSGGQDSGKQRYTTPLLTQKRSSFRGAPAQDADLQRLHRSLSNRVRTDWRPLCSAK